MLVYIDESGHPRPTDSSTRPVLLAACINESDAGRLTRTLYSMKASYLAALSLNRGEQEGHAIEFLNRRALLKSAEKRTYAEAHGEPNCAVPTTPTSTGGRGIVSGAEWR